MGDDGEWWLPAICLEESNSKSKKSNPFAAVSDERFDKFRTASPIKRDGNESFESELDLRRLKRLKSIDLPMDLAKQLVHSVSLPGVSKSKQYGFIDSIPPSEFEWGVCSSQGPRTQMEDRFCIVGQLEDNVCSYFAVFDGHGGSSAASYCAHNIHKLYTEFKHSGPDVTDQEAIRLAFAEADMRWASDHKGKDSLIGTTATVVLLYPDRCVVANTGDSRAFLMCRHRDSILELTHNHRTENIVEKSRIEGLGGTISNDRVEGVLSMTRAIGQYPFKDYVISTPEIKDVHFLEEERKFLVVGSDGLWDFVSPQNVCSIVKCAESMQHAADTLVAAALNSRSSDNVTAIVINLSQSEKLQQEILPKLNSTSQERRHQF